LRQRKHTPEHQSKTPLKATKAGFWQAAESRQASIMACVTGNIHFLERFAEDMAGKGKQVLFLVPPAVLRF